MYDSIPALVERMTADLARTGAGDARLEERCAAKLTELTAPGQVLLRPARRGFGVRLS